MIYDIKKQVMEGTILHGVVTGAYTLFQAARIFDERFKKALEGFDARYLFRTAERAQWLCFGGGKIKTGFGPIPSPDYELLLLDPPGVVKGLAENPDDVIKLMMENKIDQRGNTYYLFKFGYLIGLCKRRIREVGQMVMPDFIKRINWGGMDG